MTYKGVQKRYEYHVERNLRYCLLYDDISTAGSYDEYHRAVGMPANLDSSPLKKLNEHIKQVSRATCYRRGWSMVGNVRVMDSRKEEV